MFEPRVGERVELLEPHSRQGEMGVITHVFPRLGKPDLFCVHINGTPETSFTLAEVDDMLDERALNEN